MPEYLYPGVYVEEIDTGNKPIEGVSTSTVGFLGIAERGPITPMLLTSFGDYQRAYGSYVKDPDGTDHYLAYAVEGFFQNGGLRCFVERVVSNSAKAASAAAGGMTISAVGPGAWGNHVAYQISNAGLLDLTLFKLTLFYWTGTPPADLMSNPTATEVYDNLSSIPTASTFYDSAINFVSSLVTVAQTAAGRPGNNPGAAVLNGAGIPILLAGGNDGAAALTLADFEGTTLDAVNPNTLAPKTGLAALGDLDEISLLCCPDEYYGTFGFGEIAGLLTEQCESLMDRFAILQAPLAAGLPQNNVPSVNSEYAAYYYPWLYITNANTGVQMLVPPGGHVAGIYARSDTNVGVQKDPANEVINGIVNGTAGLQLLINNQQQSILNPQGVNCLRYFKGAGNLVWGGRTTSTDPDWQYINVRRIFIFVETSIKLGTQWVVFDINSAPTWRRVVRSVSDFLTTLWRNGVLQGATKDEAFFVRCDNTTMTQADIDAGRLICVIGIAPVKPAEFVIFQIGQWYGGSSVTEQ